MIDGAYNNESYPNDFFVDLIFTEAPIEKEDPECKDAFWEIIADTCKKRHQSFLSNKKEEVHAVKQVVPSTAFVIDERKENLIKEDIAKDEIIELPAANEEPKNEPEEDVDELIERLENEVQSA